MKQASLLKLAPTAEQHAAHLRTLETFNAACNDSAATASAEQSACKVDLQKLASYDIRQLLGLSTQMHSGAIVQVAEAYRRDKCSKPAYRSHSAMVYDQRICLFPDVDPVSPVTADGRSEISSRFGTYAAGRSDRSRSDRSRGKAERLTRKHSTTTSWRHGVEESANGACCIVGHLDGCGPSSPTRRRWRACGRCSSIPPTPPNGRRGGHCERARHVSHTVPVTVLWALRSAPTQPYTYTRQ